jgi:hypothetical protein
MLTSSSAVCKPQRVHTVLEETKNVNIPRPSRTSGLSVAESSSQVLYGVAVRLGCGWHDVDSSVSQSPGYQFWSPSDLSVFLPNEGYVGFLLLFAHISFVLFWYIHAREHVIEVVMRQVTTCVLSEVWLIVRETCVSGGFGWLGPFGSQDFASMSPSLFTRTFESFGDKPFFPLSIVANEYPLRGCLTLLLSASLLATRLSESNPS